MLNCARHGQRVYFIQVWDNNKPKIECYSLDDFMRLPEDKKEVGYGKFSITTADNVVHLWGGKVDEEHLKAYRESRRNKTLKKILTH